MGEKMNRRDILKIFGIAPLAAGAVKIMLTGVNGPITVIQQKGGKELRIAAGGKSFSAVVNGARKTIWYADLGEICPSFDADGKAYPAYTTHFWCDEFDCYGQTDRDLADLSDDVVAFRLAEDYALLEAHGVEPSSIRFDE